ncbi:MAG: hypothetical protein JHC98_00465 [Thermoleophilaceae bacterium]|nr:hypothetical protein [Thermoleophilaceae bacterium]
MNTNRIPGTIRRHITFANLAASLALFLALGGVSYAAATLPAKSVGTKQLKKNSVTSAKLKNRTITASDIRSNTLTGNQVNEATLGTVPRAAGADQAGSATNQAIAYATATSSASDDNPDVARASAKEIPLVSHGAITIYAKCFTETDAKRTYYETYARTSAPGSLLIGYSTSDDADGNPSLNPSTLETDRQLSYTYSGENSSSYDYATAASVLGPEGRGLMFDVLAWARNGSPIDPPKSLPEGNSCAFQLTGFKVN